MYKLAYGTKSKRWHIINKNDRDYEIAITVEEFVKLGESKARAKYLSPTAIKA